MTPTPAAIGLVVADMPTSVAFYRLLGLEFASASDDHETATLPGGLQLMLDTAESFRAYTPGWSPPVGSPRISLAFRLPTPGAVDALFTDLIEAGHRAERTPWDAFWGQRYATVLDPDGNGVDLFADL